MLKTGFTETAPTLENYWRAIILFGRNIASYKFSLAKSLLERTGKRVNWCGSKSLLSPFPGMCASTCAMKGDRALRRPAGSWKHATGSTGAKRHRGKLEDSTVRLGFNNVIEAFHNVNLQEIPVRFFMDGRQAGGIRLTDSFFNLQSTEGVWDLPEEVEARWRLVETA